MLFRSARNAKEFSVTMGDNGRGMDSACIRDTLFEPFRRTKGETGMGIGAYQARRSCAKQAASMTSRAKSEWAPRLPFGCCCQSDRRGVKPYSPSVVQ